MRIFLTTKVWKEGKYYIAYAPELNVVSQGKTPEHAERRLREAVEIFLEETKRLGTLEEILASLGISRKANHFEMPRISLSELEVRV